MQISSFGVIAVVCEAFLRSPFLGSGDPAGSCAAYHAFSVARSESDPHTHEQQNVPGTRVVAAAGDTARGSGPIGRAFVVGEGR